YFRGEWISKRQAIRRFAIPVCHCSYSQNTSHSPCHKGRERDALAALDGSTPPCCFNTSSAIFRFLDGQDGGVCTITRTAPSERNALQYSACSCGRPRFRRNQIRFGGRPLSTPSRSISWSAKPLSVNVRMASAALNGSQNTPVTGEIIVFDIAFPRFATRDKVRRLSHRRK